MSLRKIDRNSRAAVGLLLLSCCAIGWIAAPPVSSSEPPHRGRVQETDARRLARPDTTFSGSAQTSTLRTGTSRAATSADLGTTQFPVPSSQTAVSAPIDVNWNPWQEATPLQAEWTLPSSARTNAASVDYAAIERAYAAMVPPAPAPRRAATAQTPGGFPSMNADAATQAITNAYMYNYAATHMPGLANNAVDTDNCACQTAIPSSQCMSERTSAIYGQSYRNAAAVSAPATAVSNIATPSVAVPSVAAPSVAVPAVAAPSVSVPAVSSHSASHK